MFSSQSTLNSVGRNAGIATTSSNYWQNEDNRPYVNLLPTGSTVNATDLDSTNNILYLGGSFSRLYQNNANYHSIYDISSSTFQIKSKNYGTNGSIYAYGLDTSNLILYVGGNFTSVTDNNDLTMDASYVAAWSIKNQRWTPLGRNKQNGLNGPCNAVAVDISNQEVYVGGNFLRMSDSVAKDQSANYVAKWTVSTGRWSKLGASDVSYNNGLNAQCRTLVYDASYEQLYVGGDFTKVRDVSAVDFTANKIAIWKPVESKWYAMGTLTASSTATNLAFNATVMAYVYDSCKNVIYAGGSFTTVYDTFNTTGLSANYIARWDIASSTWSRLGSAAYNGTNGRVDTLAMDTSNQILYVGGIFSSVSDTSNLSMNARCVASWNATTQTWSRLGSSTANGAGYQLSVAEFYAQSVYDGTNSRWYLGGAISNVRDEGNVNDQSANNVVYWNVLTKRWGKLGGTTSTNQGTNAFVYGLALDSLSNLYVGGDFTTVNNTSGNTAVNQIAKWTVSTSTWSALGTAGGQNGVNSTPFALVFHNNLLYVGGAFTNVNSTSQTNLSANRVAIWNPSGVSGGTWTALGGIASANNGLDATVYRLVIDKSNNYLYVSGVGNMAKASSSTQVDLSVNNIARWNISTSTWSQLGGTTSTTNGVNNFVRTSAIDASMNLYLGGDFTIARSSSGDISANRGIIWTPSTSTWKRFGETTINNGLTDGSCNALALDTSNQKLYVGGSFTSVNNSINTSLSANRVASWNLATSLWSALGTTSSTGNGVDASVNALAFDSSNNRLYVGGNFKKMSDSSKIDQSANYVAYWDASNSLWGQVGGTDSSKNGVDASVNALTFDSSNGILYVGGNFLKAYDTSNTLASPLTSQYVATWNPTTRIWSRIGNSTSSRASIYGLSSRCRALTYDSTKKVVYVGGDHTTTCDSSNISVDASNIASINLSTGEIYPFGSTSKNGTNDKVNNIKLDTSNNVVYVDGSFSTVYDGSNLSLSTNYIAKYDVSNQSWSRLGSATANGISGMGKALFYDSNNGAVYAGGNFTTVRDGTTDASKNFNYVAKWDTVKSAWSPLGGYGNGTNGQISAYAYDAANYRVYCGGSFTQVYDSSNTITYANNVAAYDTITGTWSTLGTGSSNGVNLECRTLTYDASNEQLYVGGDFTTVRDVSAVDINVYKVAIWKPAESKWYALGTVEKDQVYKGYQSNIYPYQFVHDSCKNVIYACGIFTTLYDNSYNTNSSGLSVNRIAKWDIASSSWSRLGSAAYNGANNATLAALAMDTSKQILYVGGTSNFTTVYDASNTSGLSVNNIAGWNVSTQTWFRLGNSSSSNGVMPLGTFTGVTALRYDGSNNRLYVGGSFTTVSDAGDSSKNATNIAYWDVATERWSRLGLGTTTTNQGTDSAVYSIELDNSNNYLYFGGAFTTVYNTTGNLSANLIARWNVLTSTWTSLGNGASNGAVRAIVLDGSNNRLYVGGSFLWVTNLITGAVYGNRIAYWDILEQKWYGLDNSGPNDGVLAIALDTLNNYLYVGGTFKRATNSTQTDISLNRIARWNISTSTWSPLGGSTTTTNGVNNNTDNASVYCIVLDPSQNLYIGGFFIKTMSSTGDVTANYVAIWNASNSSWVKLGISVYQNGLTDGSCNALTLDQSNQRLYVGGTFSKVSDTSNVSLLTNRVASWDLATSRWNSLGQNSYTDPSKNGLDGSCNALTIDPSFTRVYVGGNFRKVSDSSKIDQSANYVAYWDIANNKWAKVGANDDSSNNGVKAMVRTLAYDNTNAQLYVGGDFTEGRDGRNCDICMNRVSAWNTSTSKWTGVGSIASNGTNGIIYTQKFDSSNNVLYVGGTFTEVYDTSNIRQLVNYIAKWNIATKTWSRLTESTNNGVNNAVNSIVLNGTKLYVGGDFTTTYDTTSQVNTTNRMATWDLPTQVWSPMGGVSGATSNGMAAAPTSMALDSSNQVLYVNMGRSTATGATVNVYDASATTAVNMLGAFTISSQRWSRLGSAASNGIQNVLNSSAYLTFDNSNSSLYVVSNLANGFSYARDDRGIDISINSIARWDVPTQKWFGLGGHSSNGTNGVINAYVYDSSRNRMYVGGGFTKVFDLSQIGLDVSNIAAWDVAGKYWSRLGSSAIRNGVDASVNALIIDASYSRLYVGGNFKKMSDASKGDQSGNFVAYWDISNSLWGQFGGSTVTTNGLDGSCNALAIDNSNGLVYVGGNFLKVRDSGAIDQSANYVASWNVNTSTWSQLGGTTVLTNGVNAQVRTLSYDTSYEQLYVGGDFTKAIDSRPIDITVNRIAIWKPSLSKWFGMGNIGLNGTNGQILAYAYDSCKNVVYAGGTFTTVFDIDINGLSANRVAQWSLNTSSWSILGSQTSNGLDGSCNALSMDSSNQILYVGGNFTNVYDEVNGTLSSVQKVAAWSVENQSWSRLGSTTASTNGLTSTSAYCSALSYDSSNSGLYVGGNFTTVGDAGIADQSANNVAYWDILTSSWSPLGATDVSFNNGVNSFVNTLAQDNSNNVLYVGGNFTKARDALNVDVNANYVGYWNILTRRWSALGTTSSNGLNAQCRTMVYDTSNSQLYVGGDFTVVRDVSAVDFTANKIAIWKPAESKWYALGTTSAMQVYKGMKANAVMWEYAYDSCKNVIYAGGNFTTVYDSINTVGLPANRIARWDIASSTWSTLGSSTSNGTNNEVYGLSMDSINQILYVGGTFGKVSDAGGTTDASFIASWNVSTERWSRLGIAGNNGVNSSTGFVEPIKYDSVNRVLWVGGSFTRVADESGIKNANNIAYWNILNSRWSALGSGTTTINQGVNNAIYASGLDISNNFLYVTGIFTNVFNNTIDMSANRVAKWNIASNTWSALGSTAQNGANATVYSTKLDSINNRLYICGDFTTVSDLNQLNLSANRIAYWDILQSKWFALGSGMSSSSVFEILVDNVNNYVYAGGSFTTAGGISANNIARWSTSTNSWSSMGTLSVNSIFDLILDANKILYVGGAAGTYATIWNPYTNSEIAFGSGSTYIIYSNGLTDGSCNALTLDQSNNKLYVGGSFTSVNSSTQANLSANRVAAWNLGTSTWSQLGGSTALTNGTNALVTALVLDSSKNVFAGGQFTSVLDASSTSSVNYSAYWSPSTSKWSRMGTLIQNGLDGSCNAFALDQSNNRLYVGGNFRKVSDSILADQSANYVAYWDISNGLWGELGGITSTNNGLDGSCNTLALDTSNNRLYVGGAFTKVNDSFQQDQSANRIAYWDISNSLWGELGGITSTNNGASDLVNAIALDQNKNVFAGGKFISVKDTNYQTYLANYNAIWSPSTGKWTRLGSVVSNGMAVTVNTSTALYTIDIDTSNSILYGPWTSTLGYYDASNTTPLTAGSFCAWDIKNQCWFYMTGSNAAANNVTSVIGSKVDYTKNRVYLLFSSTDNGSRSILSDPSNGSLRVNGLAYYDMITKRFYPLGGAQNSVSTLTNGILYYNGSTFTDVSYGNPARGMTYLETDNSGNLYVDTSYNTTSTTYPVACDNTQIQLARSIVMWDVSNSQWNVLGSNIRNGIDASCITMTYDNSNQALYVGGPFSNTVDIQNDYLVRNSKTPISKVAKWSVSKNRWSSVANQRFDASNGTNGDIYTSVYDSCKNIVYMGGNFTVVSDTSNGDLSANYIAAWDVSNQYWSRIGTAGNNGLSSTCNALAMDSSNQILYVGGQFKTVFDGTYLDQSANCVAAFNVSSQNWSILGASDAVNGLDGSCNALALDSSNNLLYVGGNFLRMSDSASANQFANYVAYWNILTSRWSQLGGTTVLTNGLTAQCRSLAYDNANSQLYVGGDFALVRDGRAVDLSANKIAIWKPSVSKWYGMGTMGQNGTNGQILTYVYDSCQNVIYAGGNFTTVYDNSNVRLMANRIAKWDVATSTWYRLGSATYNGVDGSCNALSMDSGNQILYVGGNFTNVYDSTNTTLSTTMKVAAWSVSSQSWTRFGNSSATTNGLTSTAAYCSALSYDSTNNIVYVGGNFTKVGDVGQADQSANNVASWNVSTSRWAKLGASDVSFNNGVNRECRTLAYDNYNSQLYVGGDFSLVRDGRALDLSANKIAIWKQSVAKWYGMGTFGQNGTNGQILAYVYDSCQNVIYAGGNFTSVFDSSNITGLSVSRVAKWDISTSSWYRLGSATSNGVDGSCNAFAMDSSNQILYVGGNFTNAYDPSNTTLTTTMKVAAWSVSSQSWTRLGSTTATTNGLTSTSAYCSALSYDSTNNIVYVGGKFTKVGDVGLADQSANNVASWNVSTSRWAKLGASDVSFNNGVNRECRTLAYDNYNSQLYVGGDFTVVRDSRSVDISANKIAIWKPSLSKWFGMGNLNSNGTNYVLNTSGRIFNTIYDSCKNVIYAIGDFTIVYDSSNISLNANRIAAWNINQQSWSRLGTSASNGISAVANSTYGLRFNGLAIDSSRQILYVSSVSATYSDASGTLSNVNYVASWNINNQRWFRLGGSTLTTNGTNSNISVMVFDNRNNLLHVGGQFTSVYDTTNGTQSALRIASWDVSSSSWKLFGTTTSNGLGNRVYSLELDISNNYLWVVGGFYQLYDASYVGGDGLYGESCAYWNFNNSRWYPLGNTVSNGMSGIATASAKLDSCNNLFYVCASIGDVAGGTSCYDASWTKTPDIPLRASYIAAWNILTSRWQLLGTNPTNTNATGTTGNGVNAFNKMDCVPDLRLDTSNSILYMSGNFTSTGDSVNASQTASYIAAWNIRTNTWSRLGSGSSNGISGADNINYNGGTVYSMSLDNSGNLYVGNVGTNVYDSVRTSPVKGAAIWSPTIQRWSRFGNNTENGLDGSCNALALDSSNNRLYVGGNFKKVNDSSNTDLSANYVAYWDISNSVWNTLGGTSVTTNGLDGSCNALSFDSSNNRLYVGGRFKKVSDSSQIDQSANYVAYWNTTTSRWSQLGGSTSTTNGTNAPVNALVLDSSQNLFIGGNFIKTSLVAGDVSANYGIIWNPVTSNWANLGATYYRNGLTDGSCIALELDTSNQQLYVGGSFTTVKDSSNLSLSANRIASWNIATSSWSGLGTTVSTNNGTNGYVDSLAMDTSNNLLYAGGNFTTVSDAAQSGKLANYVASWNTTTSRWSQLGGSLSTNNGTNALVNALVLDPSKNVFLGGNFIKTSLATGDTSANYGIIWNPATSTWTTMGPKYLQNGMTDGSCSTLVLDSLNQRLYAGGSFTTVNDSSNILLSANRIAYWNIETSRWSGLGTTVSAGNGFNAICRTLNYNASNTTLYAGGDFTKASDSTGYDISVNRIAAWNPTTQIWQPLGSAYKNLNNGLNNSAYTISTAQNNQVFVGGTFTGGYDISGSITSNYGLIWNPSSYEWSKFGGYSSIFNDGSINALAIDSSSTKLFIGGNFTRMRDHSGNSYSMSDGAIWNIDSQTLSAMGSFNLNGLNFYPNIFAMDTNNNVMYMGGNFTTAYNGSNSSSSIFAMYVVGYDIVNNKWIQIGNEAWNGVGGEVTGLTFDQNNYILYVSGNYTRIFDSSNGGQATNYIAAYNVYTKTWGRLGSSTNNGTNIAPNSIAFNSSNSKLYAGGNFTSVYDSSNTTLTVKYMAAWDPTMNSWSRVGANATYNGVDASINILQYNSASNYLLTVGNFSNINDSVNTKIRQVSTYATYKF